MALFLEISAGMGAGTELCYILKGAAAQKGELYCQAGGPGTILIEFEG